NIEKKETPDGRKRKTRIRRRCAAAANRIARARAAGNGKGAARRRRHFLAPESDRTGFAQTASGRLTARVYLRDVRAIQKSLRTGRQEQGRLDVNDFGTDAR